MNRLLAVTHRLGKYGDEGLRRLNVSGLTDAEKRRPEKIWQFFESQLKKNINFRINRLNLMRYAQQPKENIDQFVTRSRTLALKVNRNNKRNQRLKSII